MTCLSGGESQFCVMWVEGWETVPPGIIRSAPPVSLGITAEGVERKGSSVGCFQSVYTVGIN